MIIATITRAELNPVILVPNSAFSEKRLSVTIAMDNPKERATRSRTFIDLPLKNTRVQVKPGRKNTRVNPRIALMIGTCSRKGRKKPNSSLIGDNQSTLQTSPPPIFTMDCI